VSEKEDSAEMMWEYQLWKERERERERRLVAAEYFPQRANIR
jgi:hypothetical protein